MAKVFATRSISRIGSIKSSDKDGLAANAGPSFLCRSLLHVTFMGTVLSSLSTALQAQDYIDVEAERRRAEQGSQSDSLQRPVPSSQGGAVSYGVGGTGAGVTRTLPPPAAPSAGNIGGLFNQVQQLQQEIMRLNGLVERQAFEIQQLKQQSLDRYTELDDRFRSLGAGAGGAAVLPGAGPNSPGAGSNPIAGDNTAGAIANPGAGRGDSAVAEQPGEGEAYRAAYALVRGQEFDRAVDAFSAFLRNYPDGRYAPNAHYWLGELYLVIDPADAEAARQSFMLLLNQYPTHAKIPDALYKLGRVHYIKGNNSRSRDYLNRVLREYPQSPAARLASDFIDQNL